jgi:hypothetical protein
MQTEDPDGIRIVQAEVPPVTLRAPSAADADDFTSNHRCINIQAGRWRVGP